MLKLLKSIALQIFRYCLNIESKYTDSKSSHKLDTINPALLNYIVITIDKISNNYSEKNIYLKFTSQNIKQFTMDLCYSPLMLLKRILFGVFIVSINKNECEMNNITHFGKAEKFSMKPDKVKFFDLKLFKHT